LSDLLGPDNRKRGGQIGAYNSVPQADTDQLVVDYSYLVSRIARHISARLPSSVLLDDLSQAGMIGLLEAARNYDASKGASFETYAGIRIRGAILDDIRRGDWAPRSVHRAQRKVSQAIRDLEVSLGRSASDAEIAQSMGITADEYYAIVRDAAACNLASYDQFSEDGEPNVSLDETTQPLRYADKQEFRAHLVKAIDELPERERLVLSLYYNDELNLKEIGAVLDVSESRVSQIHSQAVVRLRTYLKEYH